MPGVYSDLEELDSDILFAPFSVAFIRSFDPRLSCIAGLQIRLDFERRLMPILGMVYEPDDWWRLEIGLPRTRMMYFASGDLTSYLAIEWRNMSFALEDNGGSDEQMLTLEDVRAFLGLTYKLTDELQFCGEVGTAFERSVELDDGVSSKADIDRGTFVRLGILGPF